MIAVKTPKSAVRAGAALAVLLYARHPVILGFFMLFAGLVTYPNTGSAEYLVGWTIGAATMFGLLSGSRYVAMKIVEKRVDDYIARMDAELQGHITQLEEREMELRGVVSGNSAVIVALQLLENGNLASTLLVDPEEITEERTAYALYEIAQRMLGDLRGKASTMN